MDVLWLSSPCLIFTLLSLYKSGEGCYFFTVGKQRKCIDIRCRDMVKEREVTWSKTREREKGKEREEEIRRKRKLA